MAKGSKATANNQPLSDTPKTPAKKSSKHAKPKAPPKQAKWSSANDATLIQVLTEQQAAGNQADNSWKGCVWQVASKELAGSEAISGGAVKTPSKCHTRWDKLKSEFLAIKYLCELSGWSWDDVRKMVHTTDEIWENHIASEIWRLKGFSLYDEILPLVEGRHATGELAHHMPELNSSIAGDGNGDGEDGGSNDVDGNNNNDHRFDIPSMSSLPVSNSRKHAASATPVSNAKRARKAKVTGPAAVVEVADALRFAATHLTTSEAINNAPPSTPQRRTTAIRAVTTDAYLTRPEQVQLMSLFVTNIAAADSYLAIDDAELRTEFIRCLL
ncbi:hypothetical protein M405DRAFT_730329 [Rhizopogon salebrosus TDB-379]|nr:hypothetical protein M405DRAFT_730329 [Rhizopogon salebrosus TDB-379]